MDNGRIERLNRTLREDVLDFWAFSSLRSLNEELEAWREQYNQTHPHTALEGTAPGAFGRPDSSAGASSPSCLLAPAELRTFFTSQLGLS